MDAVFPGCLKESMFLYALFYSIVRTCNMGQLTPEALRLKGKALECLRVAISSVDQIWTYPDIGAIMILRGDAVSYRYNIRYANSVNTVASTSGMILNVIKLIHKACLVLQMAVKESHA